MISKRAALILFLLLTQLLIGQSLAGRVTDAKTGEPLEAVAIYFDNTTLGTTTNSEGYFSITYNNQIQSTLVISYLGYEKVYVSDYRNKTELNIQLKEATNALETVYIDYDDGLTRKQKLKIFKREFLGGSTFAKSCKIVNEEDLYLKYDRVEKVLVASANKPVVIENKGLKYRINYEIIDFEVAFSYLNLQTTDYALNTVVFSGTTFFEDLNTKNKKRFNTNRETAYFGSVQHFLRSLYQQDLAAENYEIYYGSFKTNPWKWFKVQQVKESELKKISLAEKVTILYNRDKQSELQLMVDGFYVDQYGNYSPIQGVLFSGAMGQQRFGDLLPTNYQPEGL